MRPRPLEAGADCPWLVDSTTGEISHEEIGVFPYDHVFSQNEDDETVYATLAAPVVSDCLQGFNGTLFAYGMTGSGKTHSMRALVEKSVQALFSAAASTPKTPVKEQEDWMTSSDVFRNSQGAVRSIGVSILEIYNERLVDLLSENRPPTSNGRRSAMSTRSVSDKSTPELRIVDDPRFGVKILNLTEVRTTSSEELIALVQRGENARKVDVTDFNERSSRSHLVVQLKVALAGVGSEETVSVLNFCDLAGSERSTTRNERRKEGAYINKSLLALGTVIMKLSQATTSTDVGHIPYRDSKLTRLLQPSLSGGSVVAILCTIHLGASVIGETTNTLRFGLRAKNVVLNVRKTELDVSKDMMALVRENESLLEEVNNLKILLDSRGPATPLSPFSDTGSPMASFGNSDSKLHEVIAENIVLSEQIEHLKRLQTTRDESGVQSTNNNIELLQQLIKSLQDPIVRNRFELIAQNLSSQFDDQRHSSNELKAYASHLENRIRMLEIELDSLREEDTTISNTFSTSRNVEELEQTLKELRVSIERKDQMISALQSAGRRLNNNSKLS